jgi:hypothetical protein
MRAGAPAVARATSAKAPATPESPATRGDPKRPQTKKPAPQQQPRAHGVRAPPRRRRAKRASERERPTARRWRGGGGPPNGPRFAETAARTIARGRRPRPRRGSTSLRSRARPSTSRRYSPDFADKQSRSPDSTPAPLRGDRSEPMMARALGLLAVASAYAFTHYESADCYASRYPDLHASSAVRTAATPARSTTTTGMSVVRKNGFGGVAAPLESGTPPRPMRHRRPTTAATPAPATAATPVPGPATRPRGAPRRRARGSFPRRPGRRKALPRTVRHPHSASTAGSTSARLRVSPALVMVSSRST